MGDQALWADFAKHRDRVYFIAHFIESFGLSVADIFSVHGVWLAGSSRASPLRLG
jgi:hypothetical protein